MAVVMYVVHNHPAVMPGGAETYALELYGAMRQAGTHEVVLVARTGPPVSRGRRAHEGTLLELVGEDPNQYYFHTDIQDYDWFLSTSRNKEVYTRFFRQVLQAYQPDVVHFQHTLFLGYDILRETRRTLPRAAIVYTLHEYLPICHNNGQMFRTTGEPCREASPRRCHECFPDISPQQFFLRERFIKSHLALVDHFVSPSRFLRDRYVDWGIPAERILVEENGRPAVSPVAEDPAVGATVRNRIGYFGQFTAFKGADVLLRAVKLLSEHRPPARHRDVVGGGAPAPDPGSGGADSDGGIRPRLRLHGANIEHQPEEFQALFRSLLETAGDDVTLVGRYRPEALPSLMAAVDWVVIPSIWWENAPLVIQEAFAYGRPVICSDIGGMAEKVTDGVDGLHFRAGDPTSLAEVLDRAITTPGLWDRLRSGIRPVHSLERHVENLNDLYQDVLTRRSADSRPSEVSC